MITCGIDLSLSAPAITFFKDGYFNKSYFWCKQKKYQKEIDNYIGLQICDTFISNEDRYDKVSDSIVNLILENKTEQILMEDFSYNSVSSRFAQICSNAAVLKHKIFKLSIPLFLEPPTVIKKFACKGNAKKSDMFEAFRKDMKIDLHYLFEAPSTLEEPLAGIVDSYFMAKYLSVR